MSDYIVITRPENDALEFSAALESLGFRPLVMPALKILTHDFNLPDLSSYQALIFTSAHGVLAFSKRSNERNIKIYTVGDRTAAVAHASGFQNIHSASGDAAHLKDLIESDIEEETRPLLHVRGRDVAHDMRVADLKIDSLIVYEAMQIEDFDRKSIDLIKNGDVQAITFFSKRTAESFMNVMRSNNALEALSRIKSLCISASVLEYVQQFDWEEAYKCDAPNKDSFIKLIKQTCMTHQGGAMQDDQNQEEKSMSAAKKSKTAAIDNATEVIERFGGIRPMAKKIDAAVTTVQGWKKRDTIPAGRRQQILDAAIEHKVDLADIVSDAPDISSTIDSTGPANENAADKAPAQTRSVADTTPCETAEHEEEPVVLSEKAPPSVPSTAHSDEKDEVELKAEPRALDKRLAETEQKAVRKSTWINFVLLIAGLIAVAAFLLLGGPDVKENQQRLGALENDVDALKGDVSSVKQEQSFLTTLIPEDLDARIQAIQDQAVETQQKVNQAIATAGAVSSDVLGPDAGTISERVEKLQAYTATFQATPEIQSLLSRIQGLNATPGGQTQLDNAVSELSSVVSSLGDSAPGLDQVLNSARESTPSLNQTFEDVPAQELKAAALLLGMTQLRGALNRDNEAFGDDLQLMKNLLAKDTPEGTAENADLLAALDKLAPKAQEGVLTPGGLTSEFRTIAGEAVVASLSGEDVSLKDRVSARFTELLQIEKEGELVNGTPTQNTMNKAEKLLEEGDIAGAIVAVEGLDGPAAEIAAPWLDEAKATLLAQSLKSILDGGVNSVNAGGVIMPSGSKLVRNKELGINILVPDSKKNSIMEALESIQ